MTSRHDIARMIDHTLLRPEATGAQVAALVAQGAELGVFSVCVSPNQLPVRVPDGLAVTTVCGFPSGAHTTSVKAAEAAGAVARGADEVDMVVNLKLVKEHDFDAVEADVRAVGRAVGEGVLKVIIESAALSDEEIVACCRAAERAGADVHAVELMRATVGDRLGVKASGGIRTAADALAMVAAGACRLGASATAAILQGLDD